MKEIIYQICDKRPELNIVEITVAYNHIHILIQLNMDISKGAQIIYGTLSRYMRKEFPALVELAPKSLWGGISALAIKDEQHMDNTIFYIRRHQPDNTKLPQGIE